MSKYEQSQEKHVHVNFRDVGWYVTDSLTVFEHCRSLALKRLSLFSTG